MRKLLIYIGSFLILTLLFVVSNIRVQAVADNFIQNPSLEQGVGSPDGWLQGNWGNNTTTFTYENSGEDGSKSAKVQITSYTSGDAKWYFEPINVVSNTKYSFSDYYKSDITSRVVVWFHNADGTDQYVELPEALSSSDWKQYSSIITTPSNASTMTVFHLISNVGYLYTDNYIVSLYQEPTSNPTPTITPTLTPTLLTPTPTLSLTPTLSPTPTATPSMATILNPSVETVGANTNLPLNWNNESWGTNKTVFSYLRSGHAGTRSLQVKISSYSNGDAKWYFDAQPVVAGQSYTFSNYYKSDTVTRVVVEFTTQNGLETYLKLKDVNPSSSWAKYSDNFIVPIGAVSMTVYHLLDRVGTLITDDYSLTSYTPVGFNQGIVSLTFDDGLTNQYDNALPILTSHNMKATFYIISGFLGKTGYMTNNQVASLSALGNEIGSHTVTHPNLTSLTSQKLTNELSNSQNSLKTIINMPTVNFASPEGRYDTRVINAIKKYYNSHRSVDVGFNSKDNFDRYNIRVQNIDPTTSFADVTSWIDEAYKSKTWLVLVFHGVDSSGAAYSTTPKNLTDFLDYLMSKNMAVRTINQALTEITSQL